SRFFFVAVGGCGTGSTGRMSPSGLRPGGGEAACEQPEHGGVRADCWQPDADASAAFDDARGEFDQAQTQRVKFYPRPRRSLGRSSPESVQQPIGGGVQDQAHLVGPRVATWGAIGSELSVMQLDEVLRLTAPAVDGLVEVFGRSTQRSDDVANVEAEHRRLNPSDHAALSPPALGAIVQPLPGAPLLGTSYRTSHTQFIGVWPHHVMEHRVAAEPEDVVDAIGFAPRHCFQPAVVAVATDEDAHPGPMLPNVRDDMLKDRAHLHPRWCLALA